MSSQAPAADRDRYMWFHFVRRTGADGEAWLDEYRRIGLGNATVDAVNLMRAHRLDEGYALLESVRDGMEALADGDPSQRSVLERWYYGVLGYYFYCMSSFPEAHAAMERAQVAVAEAVGLRPFLHPLVVDCYEFRLHRARIARNQRRWAEMWEHVDAARTMMHGRQPFCVLDDGTPVGIESVKDFYRSLGLDDAERAAVAHLVDDEVRHRSFEGAVQVACRLPGFVIPYT
ncbi:MAG TPA: hypothetical protein VFE05_17820 [Longimicrobiaceae bacterium]|jgi:hypothetical protein|nr:hypothetical protein [Longimicrobiaceae bacterium]